MSDSLVTIIVPIFNQSKFVVEAVHSVCSQTYPNIQVIAVDDGSTDDSAQKLEEYFGNTITLVRQANQGPSAAINAGLRLAHGEFVCLMGGDDICAPERVSRQLDHIKSSGCDIVFARPALIDGVGRPLSESDYSVFFRRLEPSQSLFFSLFFDDNFLCAPSAMMKATAIRQVGLFHEGLIQLQDYDYWLRACSKSLKLEILDEQLIRYRRHSRNLSRDARTAAAVAEIPYVLNKIVSRADPRSIRPAFRNLLPPAVRHDIPLSTWERALLLLAHPRSEVRLAGLSNTLNMLEDSQAIAQLSQHGINIFRFLFKLMDENDLPPSSGVL